jgi:hypothetical protein
MKNVTLLAAVVIVASLSFAQQPDLEKKKKELEHADEKLKQAQTFVDSLKAQIERLTPVPDWTTGGYGAINFNQAAFTNWAAGGQNAISMTALGNAFAKYKKGKVSWDNNLDMTYGIIKSKNKSPKKNEDKIDLFSKFGHYASPHINYTVLINFKSQFAEGYNFNDPNENRPVISKFMAPAFLLVSVGLDYKPNKALSLYISPATGKYTFVTDDSIAAKNLYIPVTATDSKFRGEFGALFTAIYQKDIVKKINVKSKLDLFNNYTDLNEPNRKNVDVNWENNIGIKLGKYLGASIITNLIYDNDIKIEYDPEKKPGAKGPRTQFKESFGLGFSYKF